MYTHALRVMPIYFGRETIPSVCDLFQEIAVADPGIDRWGGGGGIRNNLYTPQLAVI